MIPFAYFVKTHLNKSGKDSHTLSLADLMLVYQDWSEKPLDSMRFFIMLKKILGLPTQGGDTSPPEKIIWTGWNLTSTLGHSGIKGEDKSVLELAQKRGFDGCPVCMQLVIEKAIITECGHKFCSQCIKNLKKYAMTLHSFECPLCRNPTKKIISSSLIYKDIKQFNCPGQHCSAIDMELAEFEDHIWFRCNSRKIQCECEKQILAVNWAAHQKTHPPLQCRCGENIYMKRKHTCKYTNITCEKCNQIVIQKDLSQHLQTSCGLAAECKCCGLPGTIENIKTHQVECTVQNCKSCDEIFRVDKLDQHQRICPQRAFECMIEGCTEKMPFDALKTHFITDHPVLIDTGVYGRKKNSLYLLIDTKSYPCIGRKIDVTEEDIKFSYIGWDTRYDEWIPKSSPRIRSLEHNVDQLLSSRPWTIFPKIFILGGLGSLIKNDLLSHKDVELLCHLEQNYKEYIRTHSEEEEEEEEEKNV